MEFALLLIALLLLIFVPFRGSTRLKGQTGEEEVRRIIERHLDPLIYREFLDVTVLVGERTTQIDHIYVSPFGIFVIETKNMSGWIFGNAYHPQWTQVIYRSKARFQNPLRQNYGHIKALESLLGLPLTTFKSVVVFAGNCTFKTEMPPEVRTCSDLIDYITSFHSRILTDVQIAEICDKIQILRLEPSLRTHRDHVNSLRRRHRGSIS